MVKRRATFLTGKGTALFIGDKFITNIALNCDSTMLRVEVPVLYPYEDTCEVFECLRDSIAVEFQS